jgi:hypothetical protein
MLHRPGAAALRGHGEHHASGRRQAPNVATRGHPAAGYAGGGVTTSSLPASVVGGSVVAAVVVLLVVVLQVGTVGGVDGLGLDV